MSNPEKYGLYYDIGGVREVTRGMAKRASRAPSDNQGNFTPEDMLMRLPLLLNCSVGNDSKRISQDPVALGTQLWGFVARFNNDETARTPKFVMEICGLAERVIRCLSQVNFQATLSEEPHLNPRELRELRYKIKSEVENYRPVLIALKQLLEIIKSPYRGCYTAFKTVNNSKENIQQTQKYLKEFLSSPMHDSTSLRKQPTTGGGSDIVKWAALNRGVGMAFKRGIIHVPHLKDWQWFLLRQYTVPAIENDATVTSSELYCLPIQAAAVLESLRKQIKVWKLRLKEENLHERSNFVMKIESYSPDS
jgi:hypothetical protein